MLVRMADAPYGLPRPEFREQRRGYHPDEVDQWIDNAFSTVEQMNQEILELRDKLRNASSAVPAAASSGGGGGATNAELDETLRRTLVLAQKTADAAIKEAQEEAARISVEARAEAQRVTGEANENARRLAQDAQQQVRADVLKLEAARTELQADVDKLRDHLDDERERLRNALSKALDMLDKTAAERHVPPQLSDVQIPGDSVGTASPAIEEPSEPTPAEEEPPPWANTGSFSSSITEGNFGEVKDDKAEDNDEDDDDDYITQLRRAVTDPTPLGPRDDDANGGKASYSDLTGPVPTSGDPQTSDFTGEDFFSADDEDDPGFGGRLRRRR